MATPLSGKLQADFSSFVDAVQKAAESLDTLDTGANRAESQLKRMADSFSGQKIINSATVAVEALQKTGDATTLTEKEQARLNALLTEAIAKYGALGKEAPANMVALQQATAGTEKTFGVLGQTVNGIGEEIKATALGFVSAQAAIGLVEKGVEFLGESFHAFVEAEANVKKLTVAMEAQGTATPEVTEQYRRLAEQFAQTTIYSEDLVTKAERLFVEIGNVGPSHMQAALTAATNLASGLGIDLEQAVTMVSKAAEGNVTSLRKVGVEIDATTVKAEGLPAVLDKINARFGGQAAADMDTTAGKIAQLGNEWEKFKEGVGKSLAEDPLLKAALRSITTELNDQNTATKQAASGWESWLAKIEHFFSPGHQVAVTLEDAAKAANDFASAKERAFAATPLPPMPDLGFLDRATAHAKELTDAATKTIVEDAKASAAATKQYEEAVQHLIESFSQTKGVKELDDAITRLGGTAKLTNLEYTRASKAAADLRDQGAQLTPQLRTLAEVHDLVAKSTAEATARAEAEAEAFKKSSVAISYVLQHLPKMMFQTTNISSFVPVINTAVFDAQAAHMRATAALTFNDIEGRMRSAGVETAAVLDNQAARFKQDYNDMRASGLFTTEELQAQWAKMVAENIAAGHGWKFQFQGDLSSMAISAAAAFASGGSITGALTSSAQKLGGDVAGKLMKPMISELASAGHGQLASTLAGLAGPLGSIAVNLGLSLGKKLFGALFGSAGRDAVVQFAGTFGGFDELHAKLNTLGDEGEQLWIKLTQGVGKNNPAQAQAAIKAITDAFDKQAQSQQDAQAAADAAAASSADNQVQTEAEAQATIETATAAASALDQVSTKLTDNEASWKDWSTQVTGFLQNVADAVRALPMPSTPTLSASASSDIIRSPIGGGGTVTVEANLTADGRQLANVVVPHIPAVVTNKGLNRG